MAIQTTAPTTTTIPGRNHEYQLDVPFYTLQADDGRYLSNPYAIVKEQWYITGQMLDESIGLFQPFHPPRRVNVATKPDWTCAWVVYSIPELREVYRVLAMARAQLHGNGIVPSIPCTGTMVKGDYGMIQCPRVIQLTFEEVKEIETRKADTRTAAQTVTVDWTQAPERLRRKRRRGTLPVVEGARPDDSGQSPQSKQAKMQETLNKLSQSVVGTSASRSGSRRRGRESLPPLPPQKTS